MNVLSVAYPLFPVSEDSSGGAEQILFLLERGLVQAGHQSFVIAARGSQVSGALIPTEVGQAEITEEDRARAQREHRDRVEAAIEREHIDLVHFHGLDFNSYLPKQRIPTIATLHLPASWYASEVFDMSGITLVCVSQTQAATVPKGRAFSVIQNGIDLVGEDPDSAAGIDLLWLGRICPEKGTHIALDVAHRLDIPLTVAGPVQGFDSHREYFRDKVQPLLDKRRRYIGPVGLSDKKSLLRKARVLLNTSLAPETSSLVSMEAISAGTPVIALASGALPEIIEHGVTGYVVESEDEMTQAVTCLSKLSRRTCLARAAERFGVGRMVTDYLSLYERFTSA